jgi:hypothetical protein
MFELLRVDADKWAGGGDPTDETPAVAAGRGLVDVGEDGDYLVDKRSALPLPQMVLLLLAEENAKLVVAVPIVFGQRRPRPKRKLESIIRTDPQLINTTFQKSTHPNNRPRRRS